MVECCEKMIIPEKELKEGIWKKKGYEFDWECGFESDSKRALRKFLLRGGFLGGLPTTCQRYCWKRFRLDEDIKSKYIICPICNKAFWLGKSNGNTVDANWFAHQFILRNYKKIVVKEWKTEWAEYY